MKENLTPRADFNYPINRMPETTDNPRGGRPPGQNPSPRSEASLTPDQINRELWSRRISREQNPDARQAMRAAMETGAPFPGIAGGADLLNPDNYATQSAKFTVGDINREVNRVGAGRPLDPDFITRIEEKIWRDRDSGAITPIEADNLLTQVAGWKTEVEENAVRRATRGARRESDYDAMSKEQLRDEIESAASIEASHFPEELMRASMKYKELREMLINKIIFKPFEDTTESNRYQLNIYAQGNLDTLLGYLSRTEKKDYDYFIKLQTAGELFHSMNVSILAGDIEHFIDNARRINFQHFSLMQEIQGASDVMRLYEEKYQEILARHGKITTDGYDKLKREVDETFRELNRAGIIRSAYEVRGDHVRDEEKRGHIMEDWERIRALNVGRAFFNLTLRAAEHIAHSHLEKGGRRYVGFPMEDAVRVISMGRWVAKRFRIGEVRGSQKFLDMTEDSFFEFSQTKKRKLGVNRISQLGGMSIRDVELDGMFGSRGMYSSWRNEALLFKNAKLVDERGAPTAISFEDWLNQEIEWGWEGKQIKVKDHSKNKWVETDRTTQKRSDWISQIREDIKSQDQLAAFLTPLIENSNIGLGILVKQGMFSEFVGYKARQKLWERVAGVNLPLMINYLSNASISAGPLNVRVDEEDWDKMTVGAYNLILGEPGTAKYIHWNEKPDGSEKSRWDQFRAKALAHHAWQIKLASGKNPEELPDDYKYTPEEEALIVEIKEMGKNISRDLADVMFPYVPFMNDVPFDILEYSGPGETMYKRAIGSDFPNFYKASNAFIGIVDNPGGMKPEEVLEKAKEIERGIESPQGAPEATEKVFAMLSAWLDFNMTSPGKRQMLYKGSQQLLRIPTSPAQQAIGMEANSLTEADALSIIGQAANHGIISHELYNEMKKKKKIGLIGILWALLRDIIILTPVIAVSELGKEVKRAA